MNTCQMIAEREAMKPMFKPYSVEGCSIRAAHFLAQHAASFLADVREPKDIERAKHSLSEALRELALLGEAGA